MATQGHYSYLFVRTSGSNFNAITDVIRIDADNGYHGATPDQSIGTYSACTLAMIADSASSANNGYPELGWIYLPDGIDAEGWVAGSNGEVVEDFHVVQPPIVGHSYRRTIKISSGTIFYTLTDLNTNQTETLTYPASKTGYPWPVINFEWLNNANAGPFKIGLSC